MSMHTKEPWANPVYDDCPDDDGWWIYNGKVGMDQYAVAVTLPYNPCAEADARRIVACVNACEGISNEHLEKITVAEVFAIVKQQRDELLAALKGFVALVDSDVIRILPTDKDKFFAILSAANHAIFKAEGKGDVK